MQGRLLLLQECPAPMDHPSLTAMTGPVSSSLAKPGYASLADPSPPQLLLWTSHDRCSHVGGKDRRRKEFGTGEGTGYPGPASGASYEGSLGERGHGDQL